MLAEALSVYFKCAIYLTRQICEPIDDLELRLRADEAEKQLETVSMRFT